MFSAEFYSFDVRLVIHFRDPIPLSIFHMPVCTTFAFFDVGKFMVIDPTEREEAVANGALVIAMNKHREICLLKMTGDMLLLQEQVRLSIFS